MKSSLKEAHGALIIAMILWSTSFVALKYSFSKYDPSFIIFGRLTIAFVFLLLFLRKITRGNQYKKYDILLLPAMSLFEPCLYFLCESVALQYTTSSQAAIVTSIFPLLVAIPAGIFLKEVLPLRTIAGFLMASTGTVALGILSSTDSSSPDPFLGNMMEFLAMVFATGYTLILRELSPRYNPFMLTAVQSLAGSLFFLPIVLLKEGALPVEFKIEPAAAILYMGIFISVIAYSMFNYGMGKVKAARGAAYINLIPAFSIFWGWFFLGESLNIYQAGPCLLIVAGLALSQFRTGAASCKKNKPTEGS